MSNSMSQAEPLTAGQQQHLERCSRFPCESCQAYTAREMACADCGAPVIECQHSMRLTGITPWDHVVKPETGPCAGLLQAFSVQEVAR